MNSGTRSVIARQQLTITSGTEERGQQDQEQRDAVDGHRVADPAVGQPRGALDELIACPGAGSKRSSSGSDSGQVRQRHGQRRPAGRGRPPQRQQDQQRAGGRQEGDPGQDVIREERHGRLPS